MHVLALTGPPRSGKTTFAEAASKASGWPYVDLIAPIKSQMAALLGNTEFSDEQKEAKSMLSFSLGNSAMSYNGTGRDSMILLADGIQKDFGGSHAWCALAMAKHENSSGIIVSNVYRQEQYDYFASHADSFTFITLKGNEASCSFRSAIKGKSIILTFTSAEDAANMGTLYGRELPLWPEHTGNGLNIAISGGLQQQLISEF